VTSPDVNVLVYVFDEDSAYHQACTKWLQTALASGAPLAIADIVLSGFLRIVTHPRILRQPAPVDKALAFTQHLREHPSYMRLRPADRHWDIFTHLCLSVGARGNDIPDAYLAALAIESGSEWITVDKGFSRFPGLKWRHPLEG
jgi:uncharacterized protein